MEGHKSPPPFTQERAATLAGKTCGSEDER